MQLQPNTNIIQCKSAVAAGTTDITDASVVDTQNFEGVRFYFSFGAITAGAVTKVGAAGKTAANDPAFGTDDIAGSGISVADTDDDKVVILDINEPAQRYIRPWVDRGTQNAVLNCIIAELYNPKKAPLTQDTSVASSKALVSPANGTA